MAVRFFISYKRNDADTERLLPPLRKALEGFRYKVFQDVIGIEAGENWKKKLRDSIECADEFLLLLSAAADKSERVLDEVRIADTFWNSKNKKPRILPIYVNIDEPQNPALHELLDETHHLSWKSEKDTLQIAADIRKLVNKRLLLRRIVIATAIVLAAALIAVFVHSMIQIAQIRNARSAADALTAFGWLRTEERLLVPRLWLAGRWKPETLAAQALDKHAAPLLASTSTERKGVEHGLLLSAQAAVLRGGKVTDVAQRVYDEQHYPLLMTSIDAHEEITGRSLAVGSDAKAYRIAIGGHVWRCAEPIGQNPCVELAPKSRQQVVAAAAFDAQTLRLVGYSGDVTTLDLASGQESSPSASDATFVAADQGNVATSFDPRSGGGVSARVDQAGAALGPRNSGDLGRLKMLAFGPRDGCITTLGIDGAVKIWNWSSTSAGDVRTLAGKVLLVAATRSGRRLATISSSGDLVFYDANANAEGKPPDIDLSDAESMAISPDGRHTAVVHGGKVTIFEGATFWTLADATKRPTTIAVAFAGNDYVVTRTPSDARVWRLRSTNRDDLGPNERWTEWRQKFGLSGPGVITHED